MGLDNKKDITMLVEKGNDLVRSGYQMSAPVMDIWNTLIAKINPKSDELLPVYEFDRKSLVTFMKKAGYESHGTVYRHSKAFASELAALRICLESQYSEHENEAEYIPCFSSVKIKFDKKDKALVLLRLEFNEKLKPLLKDLSNYTKIHLKTLYALPSKYSKRLYEVLLSHHAINRKYNLNREIKIPVNELRFKLGIGTNKNGEELYKRWQNFKSRVLDKAQAEINEYSEFNFDFKGVREYDRFISHVVFDVTDKADQFEEVEDGIATPDDVEVDPKIEKLIRMAVVGIKDNLIRHYFTVYEPIVLREAANVTIRAVLEDRVNSPEKYFAGVCKKAAMEWELMKQNNPAMTRERSVASEARDNLFDTSWADKYNFDIDEDI